MARIELWTDGACSGNPGPGGWACIIRAINTEGEVVKETELSGGKTATTNNEMELRAVAEGLVHFNPNKLAGHTFHVYTDSQYVINTFTKWAEGQMRRGWKTTDGKEIKNLKIVQGIYNLSKEIPIEWNWVRGHVGTVMNERADALAVAEREKAKEESVSNA